VRKWLALGLLSLAGAVEAQPLTGGLLGRGASYSSFVTPSGCTTGSVATFLGSLTCVPGLTFASGVLSVPGAVSALNVTATGLPAPGSITVTPTLSQLGGITVVAGAALADGDALSVGDGVGVVPIEFDASPGDGTTGGAVAIVFDGSETATQIRDAVKAILDSAGRDWTTSAQAANGIGLVRATPGATGGAITESVTAAGFLVTDWTNPTAATTYTYSLQACLADGACTAAGVASSTAAGVATLSAAQRNRLSWSAVTGAASYKIRRDVGGATQGVIWSGTALTVDDTGLAGDSTAKPTVDGTGTVSGRGVFETGTTVAPGTGTATARVGGVIHVNTTAQATTGTSEEVLATYVLPGGTLSAHHKGIRITAYYLSAANANTKFVKLKFGSTYLVSSSHVASSTVIVVTAFVIRTGAATQVAWTSAVAFTAGTSTAIGTNSVTAPTEILSGDVTIDFRGVTPTAAGDLMFQGAVVEALN
jgi:hypothetical protein